MSLRRHYVQIITDPENWLKVSRHKPAAFSVLCPTSILNLFVQIHAEGEAGAPHGGGARGGRRGAGEHRLRRQPERVRHLRRALCRPGHAAPPQAEASSHCLQGAELQ